MDQEDSEFFEIVSRVKDTIDKLIKSCEGNNDKNNGATPEYIQKLETWNRVDREIKNENSIAQYSVQSDFVIEVFHN